MAFREVRVFEVREVLRLWLRGEGLRSIEKMVGFDRKTIRRYVMAATECGVVRDGDETQLSDELIGFVVTRVRPHRNDSHGESWHQLEAEAERIGRWIEDEDLTVVKVHTLLRRRGIVVPPRTLERFCAEHFGPRRGGGHTVRVADGEPGVECQVDFGRMGLVFDSASGRRRVCHALIFTPGLGRYCFVYLTFAQTTAAVIDGCEAAWAFFDGVFKVLVPDNLTPVVDHADPLEPRLNQAFVEYAQDRGFLVDAARVRRPQDKPRVERTVAYVRRSFFQGERFVDLSDAQARATTWCKEVAGRRVHGTTAVRPAEHFATVEAPALLLAPVFPYELPIYASPKVHRDHHIEVAKALYSVPTALLGHHVEVRADSKLVKVFFRGELVKTHPRQPPGGRSTDPGDLPQHKSIYAMRDLDRLRILAEGHGEAIGAFAAVLLDHPLPWTKMRQVYALLSLVKKWGPEKVEEVCARAATAEAFSVSLLGRMLERGPESPRELPRQETLLPSRCARPAEEFRVLPARPPGRSVEGVRDESAEVTTAGGCK